MAISNKNHSQNTIADNLKTFNVQNYLPSYCHINGVITIQKNAINAIIGPSGVGKTSIIQACLKWCHHHNVPVAYFSQDTILHPQKTVWQHMLLLFKMQQISICPKKVHKILCDVGLNHVTNARIYALSKGMQQRLQLAMVLIQDTPYYFLDEPFSSQDEKMRQKLYGVIQKYCKNKSTIIVTHCTHDITLLTQHVLNVYNHCGMLTIKKHRHFYNKKYEKLRTTSFDHSPLHHHNTENLKNQKKPTIWFLRFVIILAIIKIWQVLIQVLQIPPYILPQPNSVFLSLIQNASVLSYHCFQSLWPLITGVMVAISIASIMGLCLYRTRLTYQILEPFFICLQSLPVFLILPLLMFVCPSLLHAKIIAFSLASFFPLFSSLMQGLTQTPNVWEYQKNALNIQEHLFLFYIRFHYARPFIWQGMRLLMIHAPLTILSVDWIGASSGLGYLVMLSYSQMEMPLLISTMLVILALCLCFHLLSQKMNNIMAKV